MHDTQATAGIKPGTHRGGQAAPDTAAASTASTKPRSTTVPAQATAAPAAAAAATAAGDAAGHARFASRRPAAGLQQPDKLTSELGGNRVVSRIYTWMCRAAVRYALIKQVDTLRATF